jgi:hypothetical protein
MIPIPVSPDVFSAAFAGYLIPLFSSLFFAGFADTGWLIPIPTDPHRPSTILA